MATRRTLGDAWVTINADGSRLRAQVKASAEKAIQGLHIDIRLDADDKTLAAQAKAAAARAQKAAGNVDIGVDLKTGKAIAESAVLSAAIGKTRNAIRQAQDAGTVFSRGLDNMNRAIDGTGVAVSSANYRWRGFINTIIDAARKDIPLFGGAFQGVLPRILSATNGLHLAADAAIEIVATWVPAAVAVATFGLAAAKSAIQVGTQMKNMQVVTQATSQHFAVLGKIGSGALSELAKPYVFQILGDGLLALNKNSAQTSLVVQRMGQIVTKFAGEATNAFLGSTGKMALVGTQDFKLIGDSFHALGSIFNTFLKSVPGYAEILLQLGTSFLQVAANVTKVLQPVIAAGLAFHGAFLYIGTAVTVLRFALGQIVRPFTTVQKLMKDTTSSATETGGVLNKTAGVFRQAGIALASNWTTGVRTVKTALNDLPAGASTSSRALTALRTTGSVALTTLGGAAKTAGSTIKTGFLRVMENLGINPWLAGIAALGVGLFLLISHFAGAKSAAQQFGDAADKALGNANVRTYGQLVSTNLFAAQRSFNVTALSVKNLQKEVNAVQNQVLKQGGWDAVFGASTVGSPLSRLRGQLADAQRSMADWGNVVKDLQGKQDIFNQHLGALAHAYGGVGGAMDIVEKSGVSMQDFISKDAKTWKEAQLQVLATAQGYKAMTANVGGLGTALSALNIQDSAQMKAVGDLTGAYSNIIGVITGGTTALGTFDQGLAKQATAQKVVGTASIQTAAAFGQQVAQAQNVYNSLITLATVSGNGAQAQRSLAAAGKDLVAILLPMAGHSKTSVAQLSALAQIAGGPATTNVQTLREWVGKSVNPMQDLAHQTGVMTQAAGNLAQDAKVLANNLQASLNSALAQSIIQAYGGQRAINAAALAVRTFQHDAQPKNFDAMTKALKPVADMMRAVAGDTGLARNQFVVWAQKMGIGRVEAGKLFDQLEGLNHQTQNAGKVAGTSLVQFNKLARGFGLSNAQADALWNKIAHQNLDFVGKRAKVSHDAFVKWAEQLGLSRTAANKLWNMIARQNIDNWLTHKVGVSLGAFNKWTGQLGLTKAQTQNLWAEIGRQKFDFLSGRADDNRKRFENLARQYGVTTGQADNLWNKIRHQPLDALSHKALTSASAMTTLANGIANGTLSLQDLGRVYAGMQKVLGGPAVTVVSTLPGHQKFTLSQGGVNSPHATGGRIPGFAPGSDTHYARLSPGEFVVNPTAARAFGYKNLEAINSVRPGANQRQVRGQMAEFVNGGQVASYAASFAGHPYRWGGGANVKTGWDCSSFINFLMGHFGLRDPSGAKAPYASHGPVVPAYEKYGRKPWGKGLVGDLVLENNDQHIGLLVQNANGSRGPLRGFAAIGHAFGTNYETFSPSRFHLVNAPWGGGGAFTGSGGGGASPFTAAQDKAIQAALAQTLAMEHGLKVSGNGLGAPIARGVVRRVNNSAKVIHDKIQSAYDARLAAAAAAGLAAAGGNPNSPLGGATGSNLANGKELYNYLLSNLFGGHKIAAAGATASIWGECLTLDHMILTRRGWLKHDEVRPGDETIGYNLETGKSEWTQVTRVVHYENREVVRISKRGFSVRATPNHRWLVQEGFNTRQDGKRAIKYGTPELHELSDISLRKHRIILAAEADLGDELPITLNEAALLGWLAGDGWVEGRTEGRTDVWKICQAKAENFIPVEHALLDQKYSRCERTAGAGHLGRKPVIVWSVHAASVRSLSARLGGLDPKKDADKIILKMSPKQRYCWLSAVHAAEGNAAHKPAKGTHAPLVQYYQNPEVNPAIANAIELAVYLEGNRPSLYTRRRPNGSLEQVVTETVPTIGGIGNGARVENAGRADVWCVTTELGSWTARGGDLSNQTSATAETGFAGAFLTGNSMWNPFAQGTGGRGLIGLMAGLLREPSPMLLSRAA